MFGRGGYVRRSDAAGHAELIAAAKRLGLRRLQRGGAAAGSGVFFPFGFGFCVEFPSQPCQHQVTDGRKDQVALHRHVAAALEVVESQLPLFVLEAAFHVPTAERHVQESLDRQARRSIGDEVLDLPGNRMPRLDQPTWCRGQGHPWRQAATVRFMGDIQTEPCCPGLPDYRPLMAVLDVVILPGLVPHGMGIGAEMIDSRGLGALC